MSVRNIKNRAKAMAVLQARLNSAQSDAAAKEQSEQRKSLVGSGDRSVSVSEPIIFLRGESLTTALTLPCTS